MFEYRHEIDLLIINELLSLEDVKAHKIFSILDMYLDRETIQKLLGIGKSSFYHYKNTGKSTYVEKRLYKLYFTYKQENK